MFKLTELEPQFLKIEVPGKSYRYVDRLEEAQGIQFLCPKCFLTNGGPVGTHAVLCWFAGRGVPDTETPGPGRWNPWGTGYSDLTFVPPGATSVALQGGCAWHGFVSNGQVSV